MAYRTDREAAHEVDELAWLAQFGFPPATLGRPDLLEPALADAFRGAVLLTGARHVDSTALANALLARLREQGVDVHLGDAVQSLEPSRGRVGLVQTAAGLRLPADAVVVAAGAWTPVLTRGLHVRLPIIGGKGYGLDFGPAPVALRRPLYLHDDRVALTPYANRLRLSGTMELTGLDSSIAQRRVAAIAAAAARGIRGWPADARPTRVASGLRPLTPDGLPVIGRVGNSNVYVASGHSMLGVTLAPATAEALAELITTDEAQPVLERFDPGRFGWRRSGRRRIADDGVSVSGMGH
jgi:D-amino-acid dehydrogenase